MHARVAIDKDLIKVASMPTLGRRRRRGGHRDVGEKLVVARPERRAPVDPVVEARELVETQGRLDIRHVEFEPRLLDLVVLEAGVRETLPRPEAET